MILGYFGHSKAGSTWLSGVFLALGHDLGLRTFYGQMTLPQHDTPILLHKKPELVISQNTSYDKVTALKDYKGVHVIRDPRDIIVSSYFSYLYSHEIGEWKQLGDFRNKLQALIKDEGIIEVINFNHSFFKSMYEWNYRDPLLMEVKLEHLISQPFEHLVKIFDWLGVYSEDNRDAFSFSAFHLKGLVNRLAGKM